MCAHCTKQIKLSELDRKLAQRIPYTKIVMERYLPQEFRDDPTQTLPLALRRSGDEPKPRIVFVASGGVFRGAFHIGMLGAMLALKMKPDLIVGASVGTLMGAVLGELGR